VKNFRRDTVSCLEQRRRATAAAEGRNETMSLTATDEEIAYYKGRSEGYAYGYKGAITELRTWLLSDDGMISVECIRKKLDEMEAKP
jgi:hypothetical protein